MFNAISPPFSFYISSSLTWIMFVFGLILGSFLNVCIYRVPRKIFWKSSRSFCPHCSAMIPSWQNIPLLSFFLLRGKTSCCGQNISWQYPLVELFTGLSLAYIYWRFPFLGSHQLLAHIQVPNLLRFLHASTFLSLLIVCSVIDGQHMIIPDVISLPMILLTPLIIILHPELSWQSGLLGVLLGGGSIYAIAWLYFIMRKAEGIGLGDAKLMAAIGGWLGYEAIFPTLLYGSVLGSIFGVLMAISKKNFSLKLEVPFGPFLALGACLYFFSPVHWMEFVSTKF